MRGTPPAFPVGMSVPVIENGAGDGRASCAARPEGFSGGFPRAPGDSVLVSVVREHLPQFLERIADESPQRALPRFVSRALAALISCGDLTRGFVRLRCAACRADRVIPFS